MSNVGTIDQAIRQRWDEHGLTAQFKAYWADPSDLRFASFNHGDPKVKRLPYAVYESMKAVPQDRSTGRQAEPGITVEYIVVPIQFSIHACTVQRGAINSSGKDIARALGILLVAAYEDAAGHLNLGGDDCHVETVVGEDFHVREDDDVWMWVFPFDIHIERRRRLRGF